MISERPLAPPPQEFVGGVVGKRQLTPKILHVRVKPTEPATIEFRAGQFIQCIIAPRILRQYSICSPPSLTTELELCVDFSPGGEGSRFMLALREGDAFRFRGPFGVFVVPDAERRPLVFVATGAGVAPLRSMIHDRLERTTDGSLELLFGNWSEEYLFYDEEFRTLAEHDKRFRYTPTLSEPSVAWQGERGLVTEILQRREAIAGRPYFICGSPAMVNDTRTVLAARGVPEQDVHFEKFF